MVKNVNLQMHGEVIDKKYIKGCHHLPMEEVLICPLCGSNNRAHIAFVRDDRFGYPGEFSVVQCSACSLLYLQTRIQREFLPALYSMWYRTNYPKVSRAKYFLKKFISFAYPDTVPHINDLRNARIIELGPGKRPLPIRLGFKPKEYVAIEYDSKACDFLTATIGPDKVFSDLETAVAKLGAMFDICIADQVLEHIYNPPLFIQQLAHLLRKGGQAYISTPNVASRYRARFGTQWIGWHAPYHVSWYDQKSIAKLFSQSSFSIASQTYSPGAWLRFQKMHSPELSLAQIIRDRSKEIVLGKRCVDGDLLLVDCKNDKKKDNTD